jgi:hypothetical protein
VKREGKGNLGVVDPLEEEVEGVRGAKVEGEDTVLDFLAVSLDPEARDALGVFVEHRATHLAARTEDALDDVKVFGLSPRTTHPESEVRKLLGIIAECEQPVEVVRLLRSISLLLLLVLEGRDKPNFHRLCF